MSMVSPPREPGGHRAVSLTLTALPGLVPSTPLPSALSPTTARLSAPIFRRRQKHPVTKVCLGPQTGEGHAGSSADVCGSWLVRHLTSTLFLEPCVDSALTWLYTCLTVSQATSRSQEAKLKGNTEHFFLKREKQIGGQRRFQMCPSIFATKYLK